MNSITDQQTEEVEELVKEERCENCGRSDWLVQPAIVDGKVVINCDDCGESSLSVDVKKLKSTPSEVK